MPHTPSMPNSGEIQRNLRAGRFFHGCKNSEDLASITMSGFRGEFYDDEGRWLRDGNLGKGVYLTCDWRTAVWFGPILLEATLTKGTRILDASPAADPHVLRSLKREFGHELLVTGDIRKVVPTNKHLTLEELVELTRYFYHRVWDRDWSVERGWKFSAQDRRDARALNKTVSFLKRYGFHGYGHPQDDNGIIIFAPDRIQLSKVVRALDWPDYHRLGDLEILKGLSLEAFLQSARESRDAPSRSASETPQKRR